MTSYLNMRKEIIIAKTRIDSIDHNLEALQKERKELNNLIETLEKNLNIIKENLQSLTGIEYELYYQIEVNGLNVTKAIDYVAMKEGLDSSTLWKNYYPRVKKIRESAS